MTVDEAIRKAFDKADANLFTIPELYTLAQLYMLEALYSLISSQKQSSSSSVQGE